MVLDIDGSTCKNGLSIIISTKTSGSVSQRWSLREDGSIESLKCENRGIDIRGYGTHNGAHIHLWSIHGEWNQIWDIRTISASPSKPPVTPFPTSRSPTKGPVTLKPSSTSPSRAPVTSEPSTNPSSAPTTSSPTPASISLKVTAAASLTLDNFVLPESQDDIDGVVETLEQTLTNLIADSLYPGTIESIIITSIGGQPINRRLQLGSVEVEYKIVLGVTCHSPSEVWCSELANAVYADFTSSLTSEIESGCFATALSKKALLVGEESLVGAVVTSGSFEEPVIEAVSPTSASPSSPSIVTSSPLSTSPTHSPVTAEPSSQSPMTSESPTNNPHNVCICEKSSTSGTTNTTAFTTTETTTAQSAEPIRKLGARLRANEPPSQLQTEFVTDEPAIESIIYDPPSLVSEAEYSGLITDIVSLGSVTRMDYLTAQIKTWASHRSVRHYWGFSELQDYDPECSAMSEEARSAAVKTCMATDAFRDPMIKGFLQNYYGLSEGNRVRSGDAGWVCAQRRAGRALGWLHSQYSEEKIDIPEFLLVVDDDTYIDLVDVMSYLKQEAKKTDLTRAFARAGCVFQKNDV